jgi:hypothetical protein
MADPMDVDENLGLGLYAVACRDWTEFVNINLIDNNLAQMNEQEHEQNESEMQRFLEPWGRTDTHLIFRKYAVNTRPSPSPSPPRSDVSSPREASLSPGRETPPPFSRVPTTTITNAIMGQLHHV